jgi:tetratricopeptide (TPR) repeat protein
MLRLTGFLCLLVLAGGVLVSASFPLVAQTQAPAQISPQPPAAVQPAQFSPMEIGDTYAAHHRYEEAIATYRRSSPMTAQVWNKIGMAYQLMTNFQQAERCYKDSLKINPSNPLVLNNLGTLYESQQEYDQADRMYQRALKLDPRFALAYKNLGTSLIAEHKYDLGWSAYQQALTLDPEIFVGGNNPIVDIPASVHERGAMNYYMALACVRAGQVDRAIGYLRDSLNEGYMDPTKVAADRQFASLSGNPGFRKLLAEQSTQ